MNLLPQHPLADMATRDDMNALAVGLRGEMAELRGELKGEMAIGFGKVDRQFGEMRGEIAEVRGEMAKLGGEIAEVRGEIAEVRGEMAKLGGGTAELKGAIDKLGGDLRAEFSQQILRLGLVLGALIATVLGTFLAVGFTGAFPMLLGPEAEPASSASQAD